jgi:hypothetical protein
MKGVEPLRTNLTLNSTWQYLQKRGRLMPMQRAPDEF